MLLSILAVGKCQSSWVDAAVTDYTKRFTQDWKIQLQEIPTPKRQKNHDASYLVKETRLLLAQIPSKAYVIALDERGKLWQSRELSQKLNQIQLEYPHVCFIIGGPDGLSPEIKQRANVLWSLSPLTLPHGMVRVLLTEQLYRAQSILQQHPYHRD